MKQITIIAIVGLAIGLGSNLFFNSLEAKKAIRNEGHYFLYPPYIHPAIIRDLSTWLCDRGDQVVAINLTDSQKSNRYFGDIKVRGTNGENPWGENPWIEYDFQTDSINENFGYRYIGGTKEGIHILHTAYWDGGSGIIHNLMLVKLEMDKGVAFGLEPDRLVPYDRLLIEKIGEICLGDRWKGELVLNGDKLTIGEDVGWFQNHENQEEFKKTDHTYRISLKNLPKR